MYFTDGKGEDELHSTPKGYKTLWVISGRGDKLSLKEEDLYPTLEDKCANICYCMINNHSLDGNKRLGIYVMLILLEYNEIKLRFTQNELINLGLGIAKGEFKQDYIVLWIKNHYTK